MSEDQNVRFIVAYTLAPDQFFPIVEEVMAKDENDVQMVVNEKIRKKYYLTSYYKLIIYSDPESEIDLTNYHEFVDLWEKFTDDKRMITSTIFTVHELKRTK